MPDFWNGWTISQIGNWFHVRKAGQRSKWIHSTEVPRRDGHHGQERHLVRWLEQRLP